MRVAGGEGELHRAPGQRSGLSAHLRCRRRGRARPVRDRGDPAHGELDRCPGEVAGQQLVVPGERVGCGRVLRVHRVEDHGSPAQGMVPLRRHGHGMDDRQRRLVRAEPRTRQAVPHGQRPVLRRCARPGRRRPAALPGREPGQERPRASAPGWPPDRVLAAVPEQCPGPAGVVRPPRARARRPPAQRLSAGRRPAGQPCSAAPDPEPQSSAGGPGAAGLRAPGLRVRGHGLRPPAGPRRLPHRYTVRPGVDRGLPADRPRRPDVLGSCTGHGRPARGGRQPAGRRPA